MNHRQLLHDYEQALNTQNWDMIAAFIAEDAIFIFTEDTFVGIDQIRQAMIRTFSLIREEQFSIDNIRWVLEQDTAASCTYHFHWQGLIDNEPHAGGGRGTTVVEWLGDLWKIKLEHLGPFGQQQQT